MKHLFSTIKPYRLSVVALASMFILSACEKDNFVEPEATFSVELKNQTADQERFNDYFTRSNTANITRSALTTRTMPQAPSLPEGARDMFNIDGEGHKYEAWKATDGSYYVPESTVWTDKIELKKGVNFYVKGTLTLDCWGSGSMIYILPGGKLITPSTLDGVTIQTWGDTEVKNGFGLNANSSFENYGNVLNINDARISGYFISYNNVIASSLTVDAKKSGDVNIYGGLNVQGNLKVQGGTTFEVETYLNAGNVEINDAARLFAHCMNIKETVTINNESYIYLSNYLNANRVQINEGTISVEGNSLISVTDRLVLSNKRGRIENQSATDYSVVECNQLDINEDNMDRFTGAIDLHAKNINNHTGTDLRWTANVIFDGDTYLPANECRPEFGEQPVTPSEPVYILDHMAEILPPADSKVSATSVDVENSNVYISWHEKDDNYQGFIDVANVGELRIKNTLHSDVLDFNHIAVNNGKVLVAGGAKRGGIFTEVSYPESGSDLLIDLQKVNGSSANCILEDNAKMWVVSGANGGVTEFPSKNYTELKEAKYAVKYGSNLAVLAGISSTSVYEYAMDGELVKSYAVGSIPTADGKNTMVADGSSLYICLGDNGLKVFADGAQSGEWKGTTGSVNSVDVDGEYIYVANGVAGLYILDKTTLEVLKSYKLGGASANFVKKGSDGLIYVAYGSKGVHAFKLNRI